jgi:hypothetical protein
MKVLNIIMFAKLKSITGIAATKAAAEYFSKHQPEGYKLVTEVRHVNLPALSGGELIQMAHEWKKEQREFGA